MFAVAGKLAVEMRSRKTLNAHAREVENAKNKEDAKLQIVFSNEKCFFLVQTETHRHTHNACTGSHIRACSSVQFSITQFQLTMHSTIHNFYDETLTCAHSPVYTFSDARVFVFRYVGTSNGENAVIGDGTFAHFILFFSAFFSSILRVIPRFRYDENERVRQTERESRKKRL